MKRTKAKMATALLSGALSSVNDHVLADSLYGTARALVRFGKDVSRFRLHTALSKQGRTPPAKLDGWSLPDAVWRAFCSKHPRLHDYPLGEIAERAVKKVIVTLAPPEEAAGSRRPGPGLDERRLQENLREALRGLGREGLLQGFLGHYVFELCIDHLRRQGKGVDWGYGYHFSKRDRMVTPSAEGALRATLARRCDEAAARLLPAFLAGLDETDPEQAVARLRGGFEAAFGVLPPEASPQPASDGPFVNVVVGTRSLARVGAFGAVDAKATRLLLHAKRPNVSFSFGGIEDTLGRPLHSLVKDLLDLGVAVYMADRYTRRAQHLGRRLGLFMPVRHARLWNAAQEEVAAAIACLGRDHVSVHFAKRKEVAQPVAFALAADRRCVCLFSGGLDSLAGAVWALDSGLDPLFVSQYANTQLSGIQKALIGQLEERYGRALRHVGVYVNKSSSKRARYRLGSAPRSVMAQHLRSFLFLALGAGVAVQEGIGTVYLFENGPVALNPLFSEARANTHTAHPHVLARFQALVEAVFGVKLRIENPFVYLTKGEVAGLLARPALHGLAAATNSCWNWFKVPLLAQQAGLAASTATHDGTCLTCLVRRAAMHRAGLWDDDATYLTDVFAQYPALKQDTKVDVADYLRFCRNVQALDDAGLLLLAPDLSVCEAGADARKLVEMYRAHASEVLRCFRARANPAFRQAFAPVLGRARSGRARRTRPERSRRQRRRTA